MKKYLLFLPALLAINTAYCQLSNTGLVAHWDMSAGAPDVTGNGHNGTLNNVTPATGKNGQPNTAYSFDGATSYITAPNQPDLDLTTYSICATVKVQGFYSGTCQNNTIISRGKPGNTGNFTLWFDDNSFDGNDCSAMDTTKDVFMAVAGTNSANSSSWYYTPTITEDVWYSVVATWDGANYKIYVNDTLRNTVAGAGVAIGTSGDSISIGANLYEVAAGFPYYFKGVIDDIRLYNRVLNDTEVTLYTGTTTPPVCTNQPLNDSVLIAHWDMNNTVNDVTGNGHNGTAYNLTATAGAEGMPNTAYSFDGTSSYISVPYDSAFNLTAYSICAKVNVAGFYNGLCQQNIIFARGTDAQTSGFYQLVFNDNNFDDTTTGNVCNSFDSTHETFQSAAGPNYAGYAVWSYNPTIVENHWYTVVATFDSTGWKIYVDDTQRVSVPTVNPIGTSTDGITIGMDALDAAAGFPYYFHGAIDDIRLYGRALSQCEAIQYHLLQNTVPTTTAAINATDAIAVYPNPAHDKITIQLPANAGGNVQLLNGVGQLVTAKEITGTGTINMSALPNGIYMLRVLSGGTVVNRKIVKE